MKSALTLLLAATQAVQITGSPDPTTIGTTGGSDSRTHQLRSPASTNPGTFDVRYINNVPTNPTDQNNGWQTDVQHPEVFQLVSTMDGNRVAYVDYDNPVPLTTKHPVGKYDVTTDTEQYLVKLREQEGRQTEYFYYDSKRKAIRSVANSRFVLGYDLRYRTAKTV